MNLIIKVGNLNILTNLPDSDNFGLGIYNCNTTLIDKELQSSIKVESLILNLFFILIIFYFDED